MLRLTHKSNYLHRMNRVIDHIQRNPDGDLSLASLAQVAHFSQFHFHRIFRAHTGQTLQAFVSKSRLERALFVMRSSPTKRFSQVAADCGFDSSSTFSKAFRKAYGVSPSRADINEILRREPAQEGPFNQGEKSQALRDWPVTVEDRYEMELAYIRVTGGYLQPQALIDGYLRLQEWIDEAGLVRENALLIGMSIDDPDIVALEECRYDFACTVPVGVKCAPDIGRTKLPSSHWAVVRCEGDMSDVESAWDYLFRKWLPESGWQAAPLPAMEVFHQRPEIIGWDRFDLDCCLPVVPLTVG